ncbi:MAG TPA: Trp biosynthesis-associated membrane protein [Mycobacteriales bacterium]|nr:Trp biosynthesis-associated membrane protein [Mycobacteriales bacterium]
MNAEQPADETPPEVESVRPDSDRRSPRMAVVLCAVGGLLVLLSAGRTWARTTVHLQTGVVSLSVAGHDVVSALSSIGIALIALAAAILASSGLIRRMVGLVIVGVAGSAIAVAVTARGRVSSALEDKEVGVRGVSVHASANGWWLVALAGGILAVIAGVLVVARSAQWWELGRRYDAPTATTPSKDPATLAWEALDRGEDPTADEAEHRSPVPPPGSRDSDRGGPLG